MYSIWLLEYARVHNQHVGSVLAGRHNAGFRELSFSYVVIKGNGRTIMVDIGTDGTDETTIKLHERDDVHNWHSPEDVLKKIGITPDDVDTVFITHAHYDHMDTMHLFKNATFYLQEKELLGWVWAMTRRKKFRAPHLALKSKNIYDALHLCEEERMILIDGEQKDVVPGIHVYPAYDGHSFASQIVLVETGGNKWACMGDLAYQRENITGTDNDGVYVPVGIAVGSAYNITKTMDEALTLVGGDINKLILGHETDNWSIYPAQKGEDGLWMAELALADGEKSKITK